MALQTINIGASPNDGSGDPLRTAMDKVNDNFLLANINVFNVKDPAYGAVGNGVTDDTAAIQACINAMRTAISTSLIASGATFGITFPAGIYLVTDTLNFTNIECLNWTIQGNSSIIYARCADKPVLDMLDAHRINIYDLSIWGHITDRPSFGIQIGHAHASKNAGNGTLTNVKIFGYFTQACFYNYAAELMTYMHCHWANAAVTAGSYVLIMDSNNHQDITSEFVTQSNAVGTPRSFNEQKFITCIFNKSAGGKTIRLMGDSMARHYYDNCYAISVDDVAVELFKSTGISDLWLDIHVETTGCTKFLTIDNENPASTLNIHGLRIRDHQPFANTALIDLTGTTRTVLMDDCDIDFGNPNSTIPIFGSTGGAASKLQVSGVIRWHSAKNFTLANCLFNGTLYCQDSTAVTHTSGSYEIVRRPAAAAQRVKQIKGILQVSGAGEGTDLTNSVEIEGAATGVASRIAGKGDAGMTVIGGAGVATPLTLRSTSGVGTTGADIVLQGGNNGATEIARFYNSGNVSIGSATQGSRLHVYINNSSTAGAGPTFEQSGSGDCILQFLLTSTRAWVAGIDNSDSDKFKIHSGNSGFADRMIEIDVNGNTVVKGSLIVDPQAVTGAGALTLGKTYHSLSNSSGATYAVTLAAPTAAEDGIVKAIKMIAGDGTNTVTLALTNVAGGSASTTATFDSAGETLIVQAAGGKWIVLKEFGVTLS